MNRILLLASLFLLFSVSAFAQKEMNVTSNINSVDSSRLKPKNAVKLYPNPSYGKLSVSANTSTPLHFYIFDLDGTLVYQAVLGDKERRVIDTLKKGTYLYDVFQKDESIEEGKIVIK
jgi:hypothetical protein